MSVKIRLSRGGRKKSPFYHIIIADARAPRDGKFIERIGTYDPMTKPASIDLDRDKAFEWLMKGAQPTETVRAVLRFKGVLYRKHLARGVAKGALDQDAADKLYQEWIEAKELKIEERRAETRRQKEEELKKIFGTPKKKEVVVTAPATEAMEEFKAAEVEPSDPDSAEPQVKEDTTKETEAAAEKSTPKEETNKEEPAVEKKTVEVEETVKVEQTQESKETVEVKESAKVEESKNAEGDVDIKESVKVEAAPVAAAATKSTETHDLTKIEGIGPAIAKVLNGASITTYESLASTDADKIKGILDSAEGNFGMHDPATWPKQAQMASDGDWDGLKKWQDELDGGKEVESPIKEK